MIFIQADEDIAILRSHAAGIEISAIGAGYGKTDIVHDGAQLARRNDLPDTSFDMIEKGCGFLDPRAHGRADMQADFARIDGRKEILPQERYETQGEENKSEESSREYRAPVHREHQIAMISGAEFF